VQKQSCHVGAAPAQSRKQRQRPQHTAETNGSDQPPPFRTRYSIGRFGRRGRAGKEQSQAQQPSSDVESAGNCHRRQTSQEELSGRNTQGEREGTEKDFEPSPALTLRSMHDDPIAARIAMGANSEEQERLWAKAHWGRSIGCRGDRVTRRS